MQQIGHLWCELLPIQKCAVGAIKVGYVQRGAKDIHSRVDTGHARRDRQGVGYGHMGRVACNRPTNERWPVISPGEEGLSRFFDSQLKLGEMVEITGAPGYIDLGSFIARR